MAYHARIVHHHAAASREEAAAARATSEHIARIHADLAKLHRHEAATIDSVLATLRIAFGD